MNERFVFRRRVAYHETDAMAVVHHSNHIKYFEEARVAWMREKGLIHIHEPYGDLVFAVVDLTARYLRPARFDDELEISLEARLVRARIEIRYSIWLERLQTIIAEGSTVLIPLDTSFTPARLPKHAREIFERETWSDEWPPCGEAPQ